jgi:glutamine amidotransferase
MCRLFGLHAGRRRTDATFWLVDAADSLEEQSHQNPDGFGIGTFAPGGAPIVDKDALPAWQDPDFAKAAHHLRGTTMIAHVRHASQGDVSPRNAHPFVQDGRLFAHNGSLGDLPALEARLSSFPADRRFAVAGETDSERFFALITAETIAHRGDVDQGIAAATSWVVRELPVVSLNFVLITPTQLRAFRYPAEDSLFVLERPAGEMFRGSGSAMKAQSSDLSSSRSVIVASERLDDDPRWRELDAGEGIRVDPDLVVRRSAVLG